jgi:DNA-binding NarL/FixJ family response regulator
MATCSVIAPTVAWPIFVQVGVPVPQPTAPKTILVADDNPMIRKVLCEIFEIEADYEICAEATNGEEAIAFAKQHKPHLIILDLAMPGGMSGIDAARELKRIMPQVPIILFTLHADTTVTHILEQNSPIDLVVAKSDVGNIVKHVRSLLAA